MVRNVKDLVDAELAGQTFFSTWRKAPVQTTGAGVWFDLSMSPGNPSPNYYLGSPGVFTPMSQSVNGGIPHGGDVSPRQKFLRMLEAQTALSTGVPLQLLLLDYLGLYPFINESDTSEQPLDNTTGLLRYTDGAGVQIMPIVVAAHVGGSTFSVKYTNSEGVTGRVTPDHIMGAQVVNGTILCSGGAVANSRAPFMALQAADKGIRRIESITFGGAGDIGLVALVLVKVIAKHMIRGVDAPVEQDFFMDSSSIPEIKNDAYLNLIALPSGTLATAQIHGYIKTCWI